MEEGEGNREKLILPSENKKKILSGGKFYGRVHGFHNSLSYGHCHSGRVTDEPWEAGEGQGEREEWRKKRE